MKTSMIVAQILFVGLMAVGAVADETKPAASPAKLNVKVEDPIRAALESFRGKMVTLKLADGQDLTGKVEDLGDEAVQLSELVGKEYFDAVVIIDSVSAVIVRTR